MKVSAETLVEDVQSVVLETDELESQEPHAFAIFSNSQEFMLPLRAIEFNVSHFKTNKNIKTSSTRLDEMQSVALEKLNFQHEASFITFYHVHSLWQFSSVMFFDEGMKKEDIDIESSCTIRIAWLRPWRKNYSCFEGDRVWKSRWIRPIFRSWLVWPIRFPLEVTNCFVEQSSSFLPTEKFLLIPWWTKCSQ